MSGTVGTRSESYLATVQPGVAAHPHTLLPSAGAHRSGEVHVAAGNADTRAPEKDSCVVGVSGQAVIVDYDPKRWRALALLVLCTICGMVSGEPGCPQKNGGC